MTKIRRSINSTARPLIEELEPRLLLSADLGGVLAGNEVFQDVNGQSDSVLVGDAAIPVLPRAAEDQLRELVIIDAATPDYQRLLDDLYRERDDGRWFDVVFLDANQDGVEQLTTILSGYSELDAVHLISHGSDGSVALGDSTLDLDGVLSDARVIQTWGDAFSEDGDFLIYGCDLAASAEGQTLIDTLSRLSSTDVAASDDLTGAAALGGDWDLEYRTGFIDVDIVVSAQLQNDWNRVLAVEWRDDLGNVIPGPTNGEDFFVGDGFANVGIDGGNGDDVIFGGAGNDVLEGGNGDDLIVGGSGDDVITSINGGNTLDGGLGNDVITGGGGDDIIIGGGGFDVLDGGSASDSFFFTGAQNGDVINVNDSSGAADTIDLSEFGVGNVDDTVPGQITVDLGGSESFTIFHSGVETIIKAEDVTNHAPNANAGLDQVVSPSTLVTLDASGSTDLDPDTLTYHWVQLSGPWVGVTGSTSATPSFTAPAVDADMSFAVTVFDGTTEDTSVVNVTVSSGTALVVDTNNDVADGDVSSIANLLSDRGADGSISLREAILATNNTANGATPDEINFSIGSGAQTIMINAAGLPAITDAVILDATTQPGYSGTPLITLDGSATPAASGINGITVHANGSVVRGFIVHSFADEGIEIDGSSVFGGGDNITIQDNWVGIDRFGNDMGNAEYGIMVTEGATGNLIDGNVVAGNGFAGIVVRFTNSDNNIVTGNMVGVLADGVTVVANDVNGIEILGAAAGNRIGGTTAAERNVIAGNTGHGILLAADGNTIEGNYIGLAADGTTDVGNTGIGLLITSANNTIGGLTAGHRNVISGNAGRGLNIDGAAATGNVVLGNYVGTNAAGSAAVANDDYGITLTAGAAGNTIGGTVPAARNVVAGNVTGQLRLSGATTSGNIVQGNYLGADATGTVALGTTFGIVTDNGTTGNTIGGTVAGAGNLIFGNAYGIRLASATDDDNSILGNSFYNNSVIGIDLDGFGHTPNDAEDIDTASNDGLNYPVLTNVSQNGANLDIDFQVDLPAGNYRIEFFDNPNGLHASGFGEGESFIGFANITVTGAAGYESFSTTLTGVTASSVLNITTTATEANGAFTVFGSTSEFGPQFLGAGTLVVDTTSDVQDGDVSSIAALLGDRGADGFISLREAIIAANNTTNGATPDEIRFDIGEPLVGGLHTIGVSVGGLPPIDDAVVIDATTDPDYVGTPIIRIDGTLVGGTVHGLSFADGSDGSTVRGLQIVQFTGSGIRIDAGADGITIADNWIGSDGTGAIAMGNAGDGIDLRGAMATIDTNVINNNGDEGINIEGASATGNVIVGNIIGLESDGSTGSGNSDVGIAILSGASGNTIGGSTAAERNVISMNFEGIEINSDNNVVQGNYIGTDAGGTLDRGNRSDDGIEIQSGASSNLIGGDVFGAGNLIAFNQLRGVNVVSGTSNAVLGNRIFANGELGINLVGGVEDGFGVTSNDGGSPPDQDNGTNNLQNFPVLSSAATSGAGTIIVNGSLASTPGTNFRVEFFASVAADGSGHGEAERYLGFVDVTTDVTGNVAFSANLSMTVADGEFVTATATVDLGSGNYGDTSEFAINVVAVLDSTAPIVTVNPLTTADNTPQLTGTIDDPAATIAVTVGGNSYAATNNGDGTWTLADNTITPALLDGTYDVMVTATDALLNVGNDGSVNELTVDTTGPIVTVNPLTTADNTPQLTGTIDDPAATISVTVGGNSYAATNNGDGTWTLADNTITPALLDGTYDVMVTATDALLNVGNDGSVNELTIATNMAPTATGDSYTTDEDIVFSATLGVDDLLLNDSDPNGDPLTVNTTPVSGPSDGTLILNADGTFTYTPNANFNGSDTFVYEISDGNGGTSQATVTIVINPINDTPVTTGEAYGLNEDGVLMSVPGVDDLLLNDTDVDGDTLRVTGTPVVGPSNGALVLNSDGTFTYTPNADFNGTDAFTYEISDGNGGVAQATVAISIAPINDAPVGAADSATVFGSGSVSLNSGTLLINDTDVDGDPLTITGFSQPAFGSLIDDGNGNFIYTPAPEFAGTDGFTYTVTDPSGAQDTVLVVLTVDSTTGIDIPVPQIPPADPPPVDDPDVDNEVPPAGDGGRDDPLPVSEPDHSPADDSVPANGTAPTGISVPPELPSGLGFGDTRDESDHAVGHTAVSAKFFYDAVERLGQTFDIEGFQFTGVNAEALWQALDVVKQQMSDSDGDGPSSAVVVQMATGMSLMLSAGFVSWVLRGGALASTLLTTMPMWKGFDPLPILLARKRKADKERESAAGPIKDADSDDAEILFAETGEFQAWHRAEREQT